MTRTFSYRVDKNGVVHAEGSVNAGQTCQSMSESIANVLGGSVTQDQLTEDYFVKVDPISLSLENNANG